MKPNPNVSLMANEARAQPARREPVKDGRDAIGEAWSQIQRKQMTGAYEFAKLSARGVRSFETSRAPRKK